MGFTRWPSDLTQQAVEDTLKFVELHGDVVSVMFIGGIPWPEALEGRPYSQDVRNNFAYRPRGGKPIFLSISPLSEDRSGLAPYWGERDNQPLPSPWNSYDFDHPNVKRAYTKFVLDALTAMKPTSLGLAIEANVLLSKNPGRWEKFKALYKSVYREVKLKHPELPVFFTTEVNHYLGRSTGADPSIQKREVTELMGHSDWFAMSLYPFMHLTPPDPYPRSYVAFARQFGKPIAISECGMTSQPVRLSSVGVTLDGSEAKQVIFLREVFAQAQQDRYKFVIQFASTDFDRLTARLPEPTRELASIWQFTGIRRGDGTAKPAMRVWDDWLRRPLEVR